MQPEPCRQFLRHTLATLAYRAGKTLREAPDNFADYSECGRRPIDVLAHMGDLMDWALSIAKGKEAWNDTAPLVWNAGVDRFFRSMQALDDYLVSDEESHATWERIFQGPIADALTHTGQLAMLRRLAGCKIKSENYSVAQIDAGKVSAAQIAPAYEFD